MLTDSRINLATLNHDETLIAKARQRGIAFDDMTEEQFDAALTGIIFSISVICGCQLPVNENHVNALEKEFSIFLRDYGYTSLTSEEILTAFRMNAAGQLQEKIEVYGSVFNLDYAGKVIRQYRDKRFHLDIRLGNMYVQKERDEIIAAEDQVRREKCKEQFELYLADENAELDLENCYMQLVHDGAFKEHNLYFKFTEHAGLLAETRGKLYTMNEMLRDAGRNLDIMFSSQRLCVNYLFQQMKKTGKDKLYDEKWQLVYPNFEIPDYIDVLTGKEREPEF